MDNRKEYLHPGKLHDLEFWVCLLFFTRILKKQAQAAKKLRFLWFRLSTRQNVHDLINTKRNKRTKRTKWTKRTRQTKRIKRTRRTRRTRQIDELD